MKPLIYCALGALVLAGCAGSGSTGPTGPGVRVTNGLNTINPAVVLDGAAYVSSDLPYATVSGVPATPYTIVPLGSQTVTLASASAPKTIVDSLAISAPNTGYHLDAIAYNPTAPKFLTLNDEFSVPVNADVRFANASSATGSVDVILTPTASVGGSSVKFTLAPGQVGPTQPSGNNYAYQSYSVTGAYGLSIYPAGNDTGTPIVKEVLNLTTGTSFTFILLDPPTAGTAPILLEVQDNQLYDSAP